MKRIVVAITGASGAAYAAATVRMLVEAGAHVELVVSPLGQRLLRDELDFPDAAPERFHPDAAGRITAHHFKDVGATLASGSFRHDGMVIVPCSSNSLSCIATGTAQNLIHRAAYVALKERRPLILAHRETPLTLIDLRHMATLTESGAVILPCNPGFYQRPQTIDDLVDGIAVRILDHLGVEAVDAAQHRWGGG